MIPNWKRFINRWLGQGPTTIRAFDELCAEDAETRVGVHRPERFCGVLTTAPADSCAYSSPHPLLGQTPEPEMVDGAPRYQAAGLNISPPRRLLLMSDAGVTGADGLVYCLRRRIAVAETVRQWTQPPTRHPRLVAPRFPRAEALPGLSLNLGTLDGEGFYHFLLEALPRLHLARPWLPRVEHVLANGGPGSFQERWLVQAGVAREQIVWLGGLAHFRCEQVLFANPLCDDARPTPWLVDAVRAAVGFAAVAPRRGLRLWISRGDAATRRLEWEEALLAQLPGFTRIELAHLAPSAQMARLAEAEMVVAPHGAGLATTVFCAPGTAVVEIWPDLRARPLYSRLAAAAGCRYAWAAVDFARPPAGLDALATAIRTFGA